MGIHRKQLGIKKIRTGTHKLHEYFYIDLKSNGRSLMDKTAHHFDKSSCLSLTLVFNYSFPENWQPCPAEILLPISYQNSVHWVVFFAVVVRCSLNCLWFSNLCGLTKGHAGNMASGKSLYDDTNPATV